MTMVVGQGVEVARRVGWPVASFSTMEEWIGEIRFSQAVEDKLLMKHDLTPAQVKAAVACGAHDWARWDTHSIYGRRLILGGSDAEGPMVVYLRPVDRRDGLWECLTAWRTG
jgi:hypothetical protein